MKCPCPTGKKGYHTESMAASAALARSDAAGYELNYYRCKVCGHFHMTRFPQDMIRRLAQENRA